MAGGSAARTCYMPSLSAGRPDYMGKRTITSLGVGLGSPQYGQSPCPIFAGQGLLVSCRQNRGLAFVLPHAASELAWDVSFDEDLGVESTPVALGQLAYVAIQARDCVQLAQIQLDTGRLSYVGLFKGKLSPGQTPLVHESGDEALLAWPVCTGLAILRFTKCRHGFVPTRGRQPILLQATGLLPQEFLLSPVVWRDRLVAIGNQGSIVSALWCVPPEGMRARGLLPYRAVYCAGESSRPKKYAASVNHTCSPPQIFSDRLVWLEQRRDDVHADDGFAPLYLVTCNTERHIATRRVGGESRVEVDALTESKWLDRPLLADRERRIVVFREAKNEAHTFSFQQDQSSIHARTYALANGIALRAIATTLNTCVLLAEHALYLGVGLDQWWAANDHAQQFMPIPLLCPVTNQPMVAMAAPILGPQGIYLVTNQGLLAIPTATP